MYETKESFNDNISYNYLPGNGVVWNHTILGQESYDNQKLGVNFVPGQESLANRNHAWTRAIIHWLRVQNHLDRKIIWHKINYSVFQEPMGKMMSENE